MGKENSFKVRLSNSRFHYFLKFIVAFFLFAFYKSGNAQIYLTDSASIHISENTIVFVKNSDIKESENPYKAQIFVIGEALVINADVLSDAEIVYIKNKETENQKFIPKQNLVLTKTKPESKIEVKIKTSNERFTSIPNDSKFSVKKSGSLYFITPNSNVQKIKHEQTAFLVKVIIPNKWVTQSLHDNEIHVNITHSEHLSRPPPFLS